MADTKLSQLPDTQIIKALSGNITVTGLVTSTDEATDTTCFPLFITASGTQSLQPKNNTALTFNSNTGALGATSFSGAGTGLTGTAASLTAGAVTTNANLTGHVTSVGNAAVLGSFTKAQLDAAISDDNAAYVGTANTFTKAQRGAFVDLTDAATIALDLSLSNNYKVVLGGNRTLDVPTNAIAGQTGCINVRQDITGSRTLAYAWPYIFPIGTAPTLSTGKLVPDELYYKVNAYSTATVTVTIATPAVMTWTAHGLDSGQRIQLTTTGALPTGLTASTTYWVTVIDANTFNLSTSMANAQAATFIATSGSQSGTHTATAFSVTISNNLGIA